jgi:D-cysteine desulfhydrase
MIERPLLQAWPGLAARLALAPLAHLPTPVEPAAELARELGMAGLWIKRDDRSGPLYGGNKVRKLELLLAAALERGAREVLTFGAAGSNHAVATSLYARQLGLGRTVVLVPQPDSPTVRRNLLLQVAAGATIVPCAHQREASWVALAESARRLVRTGRRPFVIPPGGSSPRGTVGFVNAALELDRQIAAGVLPEPDVLYVAAGTLGTAVGLALGLALVGRRTLVRAVRVTARSFASPERCRQLFHATNALLAVTDPAVPVLRFPSDRFELVHDQYGEGYGVATPEGTRAVALAHDRLALALEGTYTGKALAGLLADAGRGRLAGAHVLFWNTHDSLDHGAEIAGIDPRALPEAFSRTFDDR